MKQAGRIYGLEMFLERGKAAFGWYEHIDGVPDHGTYWELPAGTTRAGAIKLMTEYARDNKLDYDAAALAAAVYYAPDKLFPDNSKLSYDEAFSICRSGDRFDGYEI